MIDDPLSLEERLVVDLLEEGYTRYGVAKELGWSPDKVRRITSRLCEDYGVPSYRLPQAVRDNDD